MDVTWQKAQASNSTGNCPRLAPHAGWILLGDSKHPDGPVLAFTREEIWCLFHGIKAGEFDHLVEGVVVEVNA